MTTSAPAAASRGVAAACAPWAAANSGGLRAGSVPHPERFPFGQMYGHRGADRAQAEKGDAHQPSPRGRRRRH